MVSGVVEEGRTIGNEAHQLCSPRESLCPLVREFGTMRNADATTAHLGRF